ncbi:MAG: hypothetical protein JRN67_12010 [Nitrososphaerota archaeon]|nr:hypothetical protein [Nitrososphaerota archaeon]
MSSTTLTTREKEIIRILEAIYPQQDRFTLIGGYAVNAYSSLPRYSVDCDLVVSKSDFQEFSDIFAQNGFKDKSKIYLNELDGLETWKFKKFVNDEAVTIDLLLDGVKCRQTEATWTEKEVKSSASDRKVVGVSGSVTSSVVSKELLLAMKLHSGRDADLRDATMLMDSIDWTAVEKFSNRGNVRKVIDQLTNNLAKIKKSNFEQELKAYFSSKDLQGTRIEWAYANIAKLKELLQSNH